jgi:hypothetical protein
MLLNVLQFRISTDHLMETETCNNYIQSSIDLNKMTVSEVTISQVYALCYGQVLCNNLKVFHHGY